MNYLETKYINLVSSQLAKFHWKKSNLANFRCIFCHDSKKNQNKCRGYFAFKASNNHYVYHCFNCGIYLSVSEFLNRIDQQLFRQYLTERLVGSDEKKEFYDTNPNNDFKKPIYTTGLVLRGLKKISQLASNHPAKLYVVARKIPTWYHCKLFYAPKFYSWVNSIIPGKFQTTSFDEPRLIIPFINKEQKVFGFQGRSFDPNATTRYFTIMLDENEPKIFNLDTVDLKQKVYILEGCIDAMFLPNTIAMAGADLTLRGIVLEPSNCVLVQDNEPRNFEMIKRTVSAINHGYNVCIWPKNIKEKDINEMILARYNRNNVKQIIDDNTYSGLLAMTRLSEWRRNNGPGFSKMGFTVLRPS